MAERVLVITGATATGKTALAVAAARALDGEIISMDSRQVYRGMNIGTAKPTPEERGGIPHHGFDLVEPSERFNAGTFAVLARRWIAEIRVRGRMPILAGGTGFFLRALTHPLFDEPDLDPVLKERWKRHLRTMTTAAITAWARALDPDLAERVTDRQRLARAVEIAVLSGRPLTWWHRHAPPGEAAIDPLVFVLDLPRDVLYRRIEGRVDDMVAAGLVDEVRGLMERGFDEHAPGMNATGYIELVPYVRGERSLEEAIAMIKAATRRYARRQMTWLRHQLPAGAVRLDALRPTAELVQEIRRCRSEESP